MISVFTAGTILLGINVALVSAFMLGDVTSSFSMDLKGYDIISIFFGIGVVIAGIFAFRNGLAPQAIAMLVLGCANIGFAYAEYAGADATTLWFIDVLEAIILAVVATMSWHEKDKTFAVFAIALLMYCLGLILTGYSTVADWLTGDFGTWMVIFFGFAAFAISLIYAVSCWYTVSEPNEDYDEDDL